MDRRNFENGKSKFDGLDAEGGEITALLSALPRVDAPENFEFGVKARIAAGAPRRSGFLPLFKVAAPASLALVLTAFGLFYATRTSQPELPIGTTSVQNEVGPEPRPQVEVPAVPVNPVSEQQATEEPVAPQRASVEQRRRPPVTGANAAIPKDRNSGTSVDQTLRSANTIMPPGFESVSPSRNANANVGGGVETRLTDVFQMLGVNAEFADGGWKIRSVSANTKAQRAGVRSGDVLEAINGTPLKQSTTFKGQFGGKSLSVRRDGKTINIDLNK